MAARNPESQGMFGPPAQEHRTRRRRRPWMRRRRRRRLHHICDTATGCRDVVGVTFHCLGRCSSGAALQTHGRLLLTGGATRCMIMLCRHRLAPSRTDRLFAYYLTRAVPFHFPILSSTQSTCHLRTTPYAKYNNARWQDPLHPLLPRRRVVTRHLLCRRWPCWQVRRGYWWVADAITSNARLRRL